MYFYVYFLLDKNNFFIRNSSFIKFSNLLKFFNNIDVHYCNPLLAADPLLVGRKLGDNETRWVLVKTAGKKVNGNERTHSLFYNRYSLLFVAWDQLNKHIDYKQSRWKRPQKEKKLHKNSLWMRRRHWKFWWKLLTFIQTHVFDVQGLFWNNFETFLLFFCQYFHFNFTEVA